MTAQLPGIIHSLIPCSQSSQVVSNRPILKTWGSANMDFQQELKLHVKDPASPSQSNANVSM